MDKNLKSKDQAQRKPYRAPRLVVHGDVEKVTQMRLEEKKKKDKHGS